MDNKKKEFIKKLIISGLVVVLAVVLLYLVMYLLGWTDLTREEIQEVVSSSGVLAPLVFILLSFLQVTFVPIPGSITILAGNYIFGFWPAFFYSYVGMLAGAMFAFALGKLLGRKFVNWLVGDKDKVDEWVKKLKGREKILLFFMFLLPLFPDDLLCAVAGLCPMSWLYFFVMQLITRATSVLGTQLFMSGEIIPFKGWGIVVLAIVGVILLIAFIVCFKYSEQINDWLEKTKNKIFRKKEDNESKTQ